MIRRSRWFFVLSLVFAMSLPVAGVAQEAEAERDPDDAIDRINRSGEGLGGSIWSSDLGAARRLAARMESGTVWINKHGELDPGIPFSGAKQSGIGTELGREGVLEFTQRKIVNMAL